MPRLRPCLVCGTPSPWSRCAAHGGKDWRERQPWKGTTKMAPGWTAIRARVLRDEPRCRSCGRKATTVDHIVPRAEGGSDDPRNLQALCARCHKLKTQAEARRGARRAKAWRATQR